MNLNQILDDITQGEGLHREFKEAHDQLPRNLFETVCAFGSTIFLGVADDGEISGVDPAAAEQLKTDLANLSNNPQKVDPPWLLFPKTFEIEGKTIIAVQVPRSARSSIKPGATLSCAARTATTACRARTSSPD